MNRILRTAGLALAAGGLTVALAAATASGGPAQYAADGRLVFPKDYRTWVYLSSGMDMAYGAQGLPANVHLFDNVFVDRAAYDGFVKTGHWPEGTMFVLEVRRAGSDISINKKGMTQTDRAGVEVHVKDKRFKSGWAFFNFQGEANGTLFPQDSNCNQCHEQHGAVETTFTQFYPTLLPVAREKKTLTEAYLKAESEKVAVK